ncbi:MAG: site-2 protease family protein [Elusimicrobia bacterium]|nr:site-2 protease family protein [Elusimicrobiota bacterium]
MLISIIAVLFTFGIVIFIHEFGHFLVCKLSKIKIEVFSFGFGPELKGFTRNGTRYALSAIPLGGYVKPAGENLEEVTGAPEEYFSKPWYTRLAVVLAGPFMNYVLAFALFTGVVYFAGEPVYSDQPVIGEIMTGYPAEQANLKPGDRVISINGKELATWKEMASIIHKNVEKDLNLIYEREGVRSGIKVKTKKDPSGKLGLLGISPQETAYVKVPVIKSVKMGLFSCYFWTAFTVKTLAGNIYRREKPDVAGPIGIVDIVSKAAHTGLANFFYLVGLISVAVGFFNLLPIPLLDGGHIVMYVVEGIIRRKVTIRVMKVVNSLGIALLVFILIFATYSDILRLKNSPAKTKTAWETVK